MPGPRRVPTRADVHHRAPPVDSHHSAKPACFALSLLHSSCPRNSHDPHRFPAPNPMPKAHSTPLAGTCHPWAPLPPPARECTDSSKTSGGSTRLVGYSIVPLLFSRRLHSCTGVADSTVPKSRSLLLTNLWARQLHGEFTGASDSGPPPTPVSLSASTHALILEGARPSPAPTTQMLDSFTSPVNLWCKGRGATRAQGRVFHPKPRSAPTSRRVPPPPKLTRDRHG